MKRLEEGQEVKNFRDNIGGIFVIPHGTDVLDEFTSKHPPDPDAPVPQVFGNGDQGAPASRQLHLGCLNLAKEMHLRASSRPHLRNLVLVLSPHELETAVQDPLHCFYVPTNECGDGSATVDPKGKERPYEQFRVDGVQMDAALSGRLVRELTTEFKHFRAPSFGGSEDDDVECEGETQEVKLEDEKSEKYTPRLLLEAAEYPEEAFPLRWASVIPMFFIEKERKGVFEYIVLSIPTKRKKPLTHSGVRMKEEMLFFGSKVFQVLQRVAADRLVFIVVSGDLSHSYESDKRPEGFPVQQDTASAQNLDRAVASWVEADDRNRSKFLDEAAICQPKAQACGFTLFWWTQGFINALLEASPGTRAVGKVIAGPLAPRYFGMMVAQFDFVEENQALDEDRVGQS